MAAPGGRHGIPVRLVCGWIIEMSRGGGRGRVGPREVSDLRERVHDAFTSDFGPSLRSMQIGVSMLRALGSLDYVFGEKGPEFWSEGGSRALAMAKKRADVDRIIAAKDIVDQGPRTPLSEADLSTLADGMEAIADIYQALLAFLD